MLLFAFKKLDTTTNNNKNMQRDTRLVSLLLRTRNIFINFSSN